jgi:hypothetical protein
LSRDHQGLDEVQMFVDASFPVKTYKRRAGARTYVHAIEARVSEAERRGQRYVYLASTSSLPPVYSRYGRVKQRAEDLVKANGGHLVRAGLVVSTEAPGGRLGQLLAISGRLPILPLPHESTFRLYVTPLAQLLDCVNRCLRTATYQPGDELVPGTELTCLTALITAHPLASRPSLRLGRQTSRACSALARNVHVGPLDALSSIAGQPGAHPPNAS